MRFYFDKINYEKIYIQVGTIIYPFDLDELTEEILSSNQDVETYCNLVDWQFEYSLFDLNNDKDSKEFSNIPTREIEYEEMLNIIKNRVMRYILDTETNYTIDKLEEILGFYAIDDLKDENLKKCLFIENINPNREKQTILNLIKYHTEQDENNFKSEAYKVANYVDYIGEKQLYKQIICLIEENNKYTPQ